MKENKRLEAFTDAAFAFGLTLLAISGDQMPDSVTELKLALHQIPSFVASAALLIMFWYQHQHWSRAYGTNDGVAVLLTSVLVCTVLIYVYPLKMMFSGFFYWMTGGLLRPSFAAQGAADIFDLIAIYGYGFFTMCLSMLLLYTHSIRHAARLELSAEQVLLAKQYRLSFLLLMLPCVLSLILTYTVPGKYIVLSGMVYGLLGIIMPVYGVYTTKQLARWKEENSVSEIS